jgi:hypothetical protein
MVDEVVEQPWLRRRLRPEVPDIDTDSHDLMETGYGREPLFTPCLRQILGKIGRDHSRPV